jgi:hypothetical protein
VKVRQLGAEKVLTKPVHFDDLAEEINKFVPLNVKDISEDYTTYRRRG